MNLKPARIAAALMTFLVGLAAVQLSGVLAPLQTHIADWLVPTPEVVPPAPPNAPDEETDEREIYKLLARELFVRSDTRVVVFSAERYGLRVS